MIAALASALAVLRLAGAAGDLPRLPCERETPVPPFAQAGKPPSERTWQDVQWSASPCLPWPAERLRLVAAVAGRFAYRGDSAGLLARFGAISAMRGIRYWSVTDQDWRVLITEAFASDAAGHARADFTPQEMRPGATLYFVERDNRSGLATYRLRVLEAGPERIAMETENATPIRAFGFTLFPPGSLRAAYFAQRVDSQTWSFYGLSANGEKASALAGVSQASYVNRASALYRYFTATP